MNAFQKNKIYQTKSVFDDCTYRSSFHSTLLTEYNEKLTQKFRQNQQTSFNCLPERDPISDNSLFLLSDDINNIPKADSYLNTEPCEDEDTVIIENNTVEDYISPPQQKQTLYPPASLQDNSEYKKSHLQVIEDHLLSKVYIRRLYGVIYLYNGKYYVPLTEQDYLILLRRESDEGILSILKSYRAYSDGYRFLSSNPDIEFANYDSISISWKSFIAFNNILLDAKTRKIYEHSPDYPVFFGINANYIEHPNDTPYWDAFLESTSQGDKKIKTLIYEMLGYLMLQGNDGKCFFVLANAPNSGKSLFGDFIGTLFPNSNVSHIAIDELGDHFSLGGLWKTTINVSMDIPQSTLSNRTVSLVKTLTGDSKISAEEKYMPKCTALNRLKLVFGTNSRISIANPDQAFWNRLVIVPFLYEVPRKKQDTALLSHIITEKHDILSKSIPYATSLIKRNYEFTLPDAAATMKEEWSGYSIDMLNDYFSDCCQFNDSAPGIPAQELFEHYQEYCNTQSAACMIRDTAQFTKMMKQRYPKIKQTKRRMDGYSNPISVFENIIYSKNRNI